MTATETISRKEGRRMIAEYQTKTNIGVGVGFAISVVGRVLQFSANSAGGTGGQGLLGLGAVVSLVGAGIFIWGCVNYALGKGYSPWVGALGLLSCIGLLVLVILPDKTKEIGYGGPGMGGPGGYMPPQAGAWPPPPSSTPPPAGGYPPQNPAGGYPPQNPSNTAPPPGSEPPSDRKTLGGDEL